VTTTEKPVKVSVQPFEQTGEGAARAAHGSTFEQSSLSPTRRQRASGEPVKAAHNANMTGGFENSEARHSSR
jgi:hypothetical protein